MAQTHHALVATQNRMTKNITPRRMKIILHGRLACFGRETTVLARDAAQVISALAAQKKGFAEAIRRGRYRLVAGALENGKEFSVDDLTRPFADRDNDKKNKNANTLHLTPAIGGAARGRGKALLGLTLLGLSFIPGVNTAIGGAFASIGQTASAAGAETFRQFGSQLLGRAGTFALLAGGLELLTPQAASPAGMLPSSGIATPETTGQGAPVPLVYGHARVIAPVVISSGLDVETH